MDAAVVNGVDETPALPDCLDRLVGSSPIHVDMGDFARAGLEGNVVKVSGSHDDEPAQDTRYAETHAGVALNEGQGQDADEGDDASDAEDDEGSHGVLP